MTQGLQASAAVTAPLPEALAFRVRRAREIIEELKTRRQRSKFKYWNPWPKQRQVMNLKSKVIVFMGGNRAGKSVSGAYWTTCHLTGLYPDWWEGVRYSTPVDWWCVGETVQTTRDVLQKELLGDIRKGSIGEGMIPAELIVDYRKQPGSPDVIDTIYVQHVSGGISTCAFKTMDQGVTKLRGTKKHGIWMDEEPKDGKGYDIMSELRRRTMLIKDEMGEEAGQVMLTFTPQLGMSALCVYVMKTDDPTVQMVNITWDDCPHISPEERAKEEASMLPHEFEARVLGRPVIREGLVYPFPESEVLVDYFPVPNHWPHVVGVDIAGYNGYTAAVLLAKDVKADCWFVIGEYCEKLRSREEHFEGINAWGDGIYAACDPSGNRTEVDGSRTIPLYRKLGMNIHNANNDVLEGVTSVAEGFKSGKLKIMRNCRGLIDEWRFYQYDAKTLKPRKKDDHRMDCLRYAWMAKGNARPIPWFQQQHAKRGVIHVSWQPGDATVGF